VGLVAPQILEADGRVADFARRLVSPWEVIRRRFGPAGAERAPEPPDWVAGMFLVLRSATFAAVGGFDTRYIMYCEDADLCARLRLRGLRLVVVPSVRVTHLAQRASRRSLRPMFLHVSSLIKFWLSPAYNQYRLLLRGEAGRHGKI
jgi:GT2 family glycosyltransferase